MNMYRASSTLLLACLAEQANAQTWSQWNSPTDSPTAWGQWSPPTKWPTTPPTQWPTKSPTNWPTTNPPTTSTTDAPSTSSSLVDLEANGDNQANGSEGIDCTQFQATHSFDTVPITMSYVVTVDEASPDKGLFSAEVVFEGQGWVGFGFSEAGLMVPGLAVIGLPDEDLSTTNPGKYDLTSRSLGGVTQTSQQTIQNGNIQQNDTHTILTFQKLLEEDGELSINPEGTNFFLVAAGSGNELGFHQHRASVGLSLVPCIEGADPNSITQQQPAVVEVKFDTKQGLFKSHGIMAALAWGILAPLAIGNSLCRHLIPKTGFWFKLHRGLNVMVLLFTIIAVAIAYSAISALNGNHFESSEGALNKHKTIGLVVVVLTVLQAIGGIARPHLSEEGEEGKSMLRTVWEATHKLSGYAILAMAWYQCHSGLKLYAGRFVQENDYVGVFWGIAGTISAIAVAGKLHGVFLHEAADSITVVNNKDVPESSLDSTNQDEPRASATKVATAVAIEV